MTTEAYRHRVNATAIIASSAFAGGNLFIGLSIGPYWLSLPPLEFVASFGPMFQRFLFTIMPLFLLTLVGLVLSARLDWDTLTLKRNWLIAIGLYVATSLITLGYHMPENLRLLDPNYTEQQAAAARSYWLWGHVPRVLLSIAIPIYALRAVFARQGSLA